jgi:hypothetical protein
MALKKPDGFKKDANINVPMTPADKARLIEMANAKGITTAQLIRSVMFDRDRELLVA